MSELIMVTGADCLDYIDKMMGFASHERLGGYNPDPYLDPETWGYFCARITYGGGNYLQDKLAVIPTHMVGITHDINKRIIGVVTKRYSDGGLQIKILGNETLRTSENFYFFHSEIQYRSEYPYEYFPMDDHYFPYDDKILPSLPAYGGSIDDHFGATAWVFDTDYDGHIYTLKIVPFDDAIDFTPTLHKFERSQEPMQDTLWRYRNGSTSGLSGDIIITDDVNNTLEFGAGYANNDFTMDAKLAENPLSVCAGNLYDFATYLNMTAIGFYPRMFPDTFSFQNYVGTNGTVYNGFNLVALPFNLILTESEQFAHEYLDNGTLPPDAFLYPLDWDNLPKYDEPVPTGDKPDDFPDDNDPDDDDRDFDPTPPETPSFTVNQLTNYNWYWLTVPEWSAFISWFWNDIGDFSDFDDIIAKVKGLYNDVASAVIMCRYYPVDISWIGGLGTQSNIKLGMIEKAGAVDTISQATALQAVDIGHVHIGTKYKSFMDMSPYSQLSLYLPWHGFIDLDMNLFNGHDVYVKALYDYLSGTIQYYIYYDNELLVNTILCKMAMDIPITLQTKNDRDSAIFNNVSSTIGGLVGAGAGVMLGNPIGMTLGITQGVSAFNSANASAPMRLMGNVGESGAYIGFQNCFVVVRRPTIQPSDGNSSTMKGLSTWKRNVGMLCGYGYTLSDLSGQGFTVCHSPRIDFTSTTPLQTEVDEIYDYLEKGVIL